ncbi:NADP-dependent oxidoreductase [Arthrobacter sp. Y-9]|uniref:NADP-dependent oxidoreductase n=1 Tax=Arthrobacter sp. Y-9 TaxID=3039385 RepID=UPI00241D05DD|nr:NADP-dependent oxidoreductase [Arthrobacter sp. Y-9]WFR83866.1 NADP-dependent oxidoreductase [Arthrobacter sp. Y-9]
MARAVRYERFGGPEVLDLVEVPEPHPGPGEVRVRVTAAGLNPVDFKIFHGGPVAEAFGGAPGSGVGNDFAGVIDELGDGVTGWAAGDRVFGGKRHEAIADFIVTTPESLQRTPERLPDEVAATLDIAGRTAAAAIDQLNLSPGDTVLIGGAAGGVGVLATQLAVAAGATVIGTASERNHEFLRELGAIPVVYGEGLEERVRALGTPTAAADLNGTEVIDVAQAFGVPAERITAIAAHGHGPEGFTATGGGDATPGALGRIASGLAEGSLVLPLEASHPVEEVADAYRLLEDGHVRGKVVVTLS